MGFNSTLANIDNKIINILSKVENEDLLKFGMIPEFIGRLPVCATLEELDEKMLIRIMKEPKNAIIKQYQQLFHNDDIELEFTEDALEAAAEVALTQNTGARSLRYIVEKTLLDVMYELPSMNHVSKCIVDRDCILDKSTPTLIDKLNIEFKLPANDIQKSA